MKKAFILLFIVSSFTLSAQIQKPAKWTFTTSKTTAKIGETIDLIFTATIDDNWYMNSSQLKVEGPLPTTVNFIGSESYKAIGKLIPINPKEKYKEVWKGKMQYFVHEAKFIQKIKITKANPAIEGKIESQTCTIQNGSCVTNRDKFKFDVKTI